VLGSNASYVGFAVPRTLRQSLDTKKYASGRRKSAAGYPPILLRLEISPIVCFLQLMTNSN